jgi:hypothetical protein
VNASGPPGRQGAEISGRLSSFGVSRRDGYSLAHDRLQVALFDRQGTRHVIEGRTRIT